MIEFQAEIKRFASQGEKTGWTYIDVPETIASQLKPGNKKGFQVKGKLDTYPFKGINLLPMGGGDFILTLNATIRKAIGKSKGAIVQVALNEDKVAYELNEELMICLEDYPDVKEIFDALTRSHKNYYSKWIDSAKGETTRAKRIAIVIRGLGDGLDFGGMLRREREEKQALGR